MQIFRLTNRGRGKWECQVACRPICVFFLRIVKVPRSKPHSKKLCENKTAVLGKMRRKKGGKSGKWRKCEGKKAKRQHARMACGFGWLNHKRKARCQRREWANSLNKNFISLIKCIIKLQKQWQNPWRSWAWRHKRKFRSAAPAVAGLGKVRRKKGYNFHLPDDNRQRISSISFPLPLWKAQPI